MINLANDVQKKSIRLCIQIMTNINDFVRCPFRAVLKMVKLTRIDKNKSN